MHVAFNYGQATGSAQLLRFITEHTEVSLLCLDLLQVMSTTVGFRALTI